MLIRDSANDVWIGASGGAEVADRLHVDAAVAKCRDQPGIRQLLIEDQEAHTWRLQLGGGLDPAE